jgi:hypothetical protein
MYARRKDSTPPCECKSTAKFCTFATWVQSCYLVVYVMGTLLSREQLGENRFTLGVALMYTM